MDSKCISNICAFIAAAGLAYAYISESPTCVSLISLAYLSVENSTKRTNFRPAVYSFIQNIKKWR